MFCCLSCLNKLSYVIYVEYLSVAVVVVMCRSVYGAVMLLNISPSSTLLGGFMSVIQHPTATTRHTPLPSHWVGWPGEPPALFHIHLGRRGHGRYRREVWWMLAMYQWLVVQNSSVMLLLLVIRLTLMILFHLSLQLVKVSVGFMYFMSSAAFSSGGNYCMYELAGGIYNWNAFGNLDTWVVAFTKRVCSYQSVFSQYQENTNSTFMLVSMADAL